MDSPILIVKDIYSGYDDVPVIHGISLNVMKGELVSIVGANGAGKTTTIRTIAGLMHPTKGSVSFLGEDISCVSAHQILRKGISYVPEGRHLFPKLSVLKNLSLGAYAEKNRNEINKLLAEVFSLFPILEKRTDQVAETLSGGQQQMLAIARGMMSHPKLLMLDELSLGLMPSLVEKVMETISRINRRGMTVLLVEQRVEEALEISHRSYVIQTGRIVQSGLAQDLMNSAEIRKAYMGM
ncbi:MAG: branched-chain amino acid ABC transporter ATP-binding protein [Anaerolinea sp. 4484_236]|nr:MAG: branched-chain amino acid ABC transporter ATP-binding protein [Anaerolinea sp. 4484_236]